MNWKVVVLPEFYSDLEEAADWYAHKLEGLGARFAGKVLDVWADLAVNPLLNSEKTTSTKYPLAIPGQISLQSRLLCGGGNKNCRGHSIASRCKTCGDSS